MVSENVKPFEELPGPTKYQLIRGVLPGGMFHNKSLKEFGNVCREKYGNIFRIPGTFGIPSIIMSFDPDHYEKIFRTDGVWPFRRPLESLIYFRENLQKEFYAGSHGLTNA